MPRLEPANFENVPNLVVGRYDIGRTEQQDGGGYAGEENGKS
jgi:hypothetical protein